MKECEEIDDWRYNAGFWISWEPDREAAKAGLHAMGERSEAVPWAVLRAYDADGNLLLVRTQEE